MSEERRSLPGQILTFTSGRILSTTSTDAGQTSSYEINDPTGRALTSDRFVNSFIMVVYANVFGCSVRIFCPKYY